MSMGDPGQDPTPAAENSAESFAARLDEATGNSPQTEAPQSAPEPQAQTPATQTEEQLGGHPAWKPFQDALGPAHYRTIEPHLRSMNQAFESKIAATNKSLEPWKTFIDEGVDPQELAFTRQLANEINTDPVGFYSKLEAYLRQTGQLEAAAQAGQAADAAAAELGEDPNEDPQVAQLRQQLELVQAQQAEFQQQQLAAYQQQQYEQSVQAQVSSLHEEVQGLVGKGVDERTLRAVLDQAELEHFRGGKPRPLEEIYTEISQSQQFIRNQPQAVDRAPRLPGVTGGAPSQGTVDLSTASRSQTQDTFAALLEANRGR